MWQADCDGLCTQSFPVTTWAVFWLNSDLGLEEKNHLDMKLLPSAKVIILRVMHGLKTEIQSKQIHDRG
jgi:hypothetical protein